MPSTNDYHVNTQFKIGGGESLAPATVAPATARMMGSKGHSQQNSLIVPTEGTEGSGDSKSHQSHKSGRSHAMEPRQFHRKSLGEWDFLETVGAGSMGKVKLAKHRFTGEVCAIKIVNRATNAFLHKEQSLPPPKKEEEILERQKKLEKEISRDKRTIREASLGQILYHPHICRLFEMCTMSNHFYMLFEYVSGGQLLDYIIQHGSLREHHARKFTRGIASALQYLHANNIVHRDLKIENIMISTSGEIKIIDFGLSNLFDRRKQLHTFCGSLYFAAPELLKASPYTGPEVDVWSFGVVLYVLVCGKVPFDDENSSVLHEKIKQGKVDYPQHLSIEVISLLSKMLVVDPKRRATLKQVAEHHWMIRGYDCPPPSYVPNRIPLTPEMLDINVVKEMFRLEFIDDIDETMRFLNSIVTEDLYVQLSKQYWAALTNLNVHSISSGVNGSRSGDIADSSNSSFDRPHDRYNKREPFEDPTRAYHPLLSIYYLVDEMLRRKLAKLQRKQQAALLQQQQQQEQQQQTRLEKPVAVEHSNGKVVEPEPNNEVPSPTLRDSGVPAAAPLAPPAVTANIKGGKQRPLQVLVPPKLAIPEQAHTSPTSKKGLEGNKDPELVLSPIPQVNDYQQRSASPNSIETGDKPKFGNIFRKLSQRRAQNQAEQQAHTVNQYSRVQNQTPPQIQISGEGGKRILKTHSRAISECTPASIKSAAFAGGAIPALDNSKRIGGTPVRSASHKQNADLPALPVNAETMVQQQRQKLVERDMGKLNVADTSSTSEAGEDHSMKDDMLSQDESKPLPPLNVTKGRKLHPSARAKSVGHARRESLKFMRPPVPAAVSPKDYDESGFLDHNENTKNYNDTDDTISIGASTAVRSAGTNVEFTNVDSMTAGEDELSDEQVLEDASKAPPGSMPSIDYPRSLFLKGFFSVQTTSSKPLPIVRYKIIHVLKKMHIEFKEVKGGFVCVLHFANPVAQGMVDNAPPAQQQFLQPTAPAESVRRSGSRHGSMRRQGSVKYTQAAAPSTPVSGSTAATHDRNLSLTSSPRPNNISGDLSSPSFESLHHDDILTTSRAYDMNKIESGRDETTSTKEKPPIKFEIHIVKVRIVGLAGVHFKKVSGNTWLYKEIASDILKQLNL